MAYRSKKLFTEPMSDQASLSNRIHQEQLLLPHMATYACPLRTQKVLANRSALSPHRLCTYQKLNNHTSS